MVLSLVGHPRDEWHPRFRITSALTILVHAPSSEGRREVQVGLQRFDLIAFQPDDI
jgi:hypothetical protein